MLDSNTVCAISSDVNGETALVRMSGGDTVSIAEKVGFVIDEPWALCDGFIDLEIGSCPYEFVFMPKGKSFTGFDTLELQVPANKIILEQLIDKLCANGCEQAQAGDFTRQAVLNERITLDQAEAIYAITTSLSEDSCKHAIERLKGTLSKDIVVMKDKLLALIAKVELGLDFMEEEDIVLFEEEELKAEIKEVLFLLKKWQRAIVDIGEEPTVCLVGNVNAGKSSLFTELTGEKAIASDIEGTTRDYITGFITLTDGRKIKIIDTAGLHETNDYIDSTAQSETWQLSKYASLIVALESNDSILPESFLSEKKLLEKTIKIKTKADLFSYDSGIVVSVKDKTGIDLLKKEIEIRIGNKFSGDTGQQRILRKVQDVLEPLIGENALPEDELLADDLKCASKLLQDLIGETLTDDMLDIIFSKFCIGK